jgi:hypothetical protein
MRVDFEDGQWAEIHSAREMPRLVTVRLQEMLAEIPEDQNGYAHNRDFGRMRDTLMAMVTKQWSYDGEPGDTAETVYALPQASYDKLKEETRDHWVKAGFFEESEKEEEKPKTRRKTTSATTSSA